MARRELGLERLYPAQREAVDAVFRGRDTLAILATGSGKSAIYQVAGFMRPGPTVVTSPLLEDEPPIAIGARVTHADFGPGVVTGFENGRLTAIYDESGYRTVLADDALERGILQVPDG